MPTVVPSDGARYFSKGFGDQHASPAFEYIFDSGVVWQPIINGTAGAITTGGWRPVIPSDLASTSTVNVSGGLSVNVGSVAVTGGQLTILNPIVATSGVVQGGNSLPIYVTGNVGAQNPIGTTGTDIDLSANYTSNALAPYNFLAIGGRVTNPSGEGSVTGAYTTGQMAIVNFAPNGGIYTNQGILDPTQDAVTAWPAGSTGVSNDVISGAFGLALPGNTNRKQWFIQNLATGGLLVRYSTSNPTSSAFNMVLKGGVNSSDGLGGNYSDSIYRGPVSVTGQGGASVSYTIWEVV